MALTTHTTPATRAPRPASVASRRPPTLTLLALALVAALLTVVIVGAAAPPAVAAGTPNLALAVDAQDTVVLGQSASVKLTASTPAGASAKGYNLSYRIVLPSGISYVAASAGSTAGEPTVVANQPGAGQTTLLWTALADPPPGTSHDLTFKVDHSVGLGAQGTFTVRADAFVDTNAATVPPFTATGAPGTPAATGSAENVTDTVRINPLSVTKTSAGTPEDELLRGVHDQQTIWTITVRNTGQAAITNAFLTDYLPAGMEFLGCGGPGADKTTNAPTNPGSAQEYPGAGAISVPAVTGCQTPATVISSTYDPDVGGTAFTSGIYTQVRWSLLTLNAGATVTIRYRAAIPLRRNTATWVGAAPSTSGAQATNLNNNSGTEVADEEVLRSFTTASGFYAGGAQVLGGDTITTRTAEDLAIRKTAQTSALSQRTTTTWDLELRTSEYRDASNVVVTDTIPDGLCPLKAGVNLTRAPQSPADTTDCTGAAGQSPSHPYATSVEHADGTWDLTWNQSTDPALAQLSPSSIHTISFPTATRTNYQEAYEDAAPILSGDTVTNAVTVGGSARVVCTNGDACPPGAATGNEIAHDGPLATGVTDVSSDKLTAAAATLDKKVSTSTNSGNCAAATYTDGAIIPAYRPGDRICWLLQVAYPPGVDSQDDTIVDRLPQSLTYDGSYGTLGEDPTAGDTAGTGGVDASLAIPGPGGELRWTVPSTYVGGGKTFERRIATKVGLPAGSAVGDVASNILKSATQATGGATTALRDSAPYKLAMPIMSTEKRVVALAGTDLPAPVATQIVRGGEAVKFQVRIENASTDVKAERVEVWDRLPAGVTCADVTAAGGSISDAGVCDTADNTIKWGAGANPAPDVPVRTGTTNGAKNLTYLVRVPESTRPTQSLTSGAGIRQYRTTTNVGDDFTYVPASNVDATQNASANVNAASSSATLIGKEPSITTTRTTSITESDAGIDYNSAADATIGEVITYKVTTTIPAGLTVDDFRVTDTVDARHTFLPATLTLTTGATPAGGSFGATGSAIELYLGPSWTAPTGADSVFTFTFDAIVADVPGNFRTGLPMSNVGMLGYTNPNSAPPRNELTAVPATTTVVEPYLGVDKTVDVGTNPVIGGQVVEYTVKVTAGTGDANPAHETTLVDKVPDGLTPLKPGGAPVDTNGDATASGGVWSETDHTITFFPAATILPGRTQTFTYRASVDIPPVAGTSLTNTATARTTSLAGTPTLPVRERSISSARTVGYEATDAVTLTAKTASVSAARSPANLTPGEQTTYTQTVTIPANTVYYDTFVRDALPPEMEFDQHVSQVCTAGCDPSTTPVFNTYTPVTSGGNVQVVAWDLGDLTTSAPQTRTIELVYKAHLRTKRRGVGTDVLRPAQAVSAATVASNRTNRVGAFDAAAIPAPTGGFNDVSPISNATITTIEPALAITKQIAVGNGSFGSATVPVRDGDALRYRVTIANTGDHAAHDLEIRDIPSPKLRNVVLAPGVTQATNTAAGTWAAPGDDLGWFIPGPIAAGTSVVLEYSADLPVVTDMRDNDAFANTASIQHAWGVPLAERTARPGPQFLYRDYSVSTSPELARTVTAIYDAPTLSAVKTTAGTTTAEIGKLFTWRVTITNTSGTAAGKNLVVRDTLPRDWDYEPGTASFTTGSTANPTITPQATGDELVWNTTIPLAAGASVQLTYQARPAIESATTIGTGTGVAQRHVNRATAEVVNSVDHAADGNGLFKPAVDATAFASLAVPIVGVAKTPDAGSAIAGTTVDYSIRIKNTGTVSATNVLVTDTLPVDGIANTYAAGSATSPAAFTEQSATDDTVVFRIATLAAGTTVDIKVPVRTDPAAPEASDVVNSVSVASTQTLPVTDTGSVRVTGSADLQASKTAPASVVAGRTLDYVLGARNLGPSVARDVVLTDTLPATVTPGTLPNECAPTAVPRQIVCTFPGATSVGGSVSATIRATVNASATSDANNTVAVSSATADPVAGNNAKSVLVDITEQADLGLLQTITAGSAGATPADPWTIKALRGETVEFALTARNDGPSDAPAAKITAVLPAGLAFASADAACAYDGPSRTVTCAPGGGLPSALGTTTTFLVRVTATDLGTHTVTSALVAGAGGPVDPTPGDLTDSALVIVEPGVQLGLTLTAYGAGPKAAAAGPSASAISTVGAGELLTYTAVGTNTGSDAATDATITLALPAGTTFEQADTGCTERGAGSVTCALGTVPGKDAANPSGGSVTRQITVVAPVALAGQALTANARFSSTETELSPLDASEAVAASASTQVGPAADLSITQEAPTEAVAGGQMTYTLVVRNDGPSAAPGVIVTDALPAGTTFALASSSTGSCTQVGGVVTCDLGSLASGSSTVVTITVDLPASLAGRTLRNDASVRSSVVDPTPADASSSLARRLPDPPPVPVVVPEPDPTPAPAPPPATPAPVVPAPPGTANLTLTKKAEGVARAGSELTYVITATNKGPAATTGVVVTDALVGGVEYKNARAGDGRCGFETGTVRCRIGDLKADETVNMRVIVVPSRTGMLVNNAVLSSDLTDPDMSDNRAVASNAVSPLPPTAVKVSAKGSSVSLRGGQRVTFTIKARNTGKNPASNVEVCDRLPAQMAFTSTKGGVLKGSRLCFTQPSLAPGKTATFKVKARLSARARRGKLVNRSTADAENAAQQNTSATVTVVTDGKVGAGMVRGFTG